MRLFEATLLLLLTDTANAACGPDGSSFTIAGSTTVFPIATYWEGTYEEECPTIDISVEGGGSSTGARAVCGVADNPNAMIGMMSRNWKDSEVTLGGDGYTYSCLIGDNEFLAARFIASNDGVTVLAEEGGAAGDCIESLGEAGISGDQLRWMFSSFTESELEADGWDPSSLPNSDGDETTRLWSELSSDCPDASIVLAIPDVTGGTYEFFTDAILGGDGETIREGDAIIVPEGDEPVLEIVSEIPAAIGFVGFPFFASSTSKTAAPVEGVFPTLDSISQGDYSLLGRQIYMNLRVTGKLKQTVPYLEHGYAEPTLDGFVPLSEGQLEEMDFRIANLNGMVKGSSKKKKNKKKKNKKKKKKKF